MASLKCVCEIAKILNDLNYFDKYDSILQLAKKSYNDKLWNGKYYQYDSSHSRYSNSIMTDMCCGHWYLRSCGFKYDVDNIISLIYVMAHYVNHVSLINGDNVNLRIMRARINNYSSICYPFYRFEARRGKQRWAGMMAVI